MQTFYTFWSLVLIWTLVACGAPQASQPTAAPSPTQQVASAPPATEQPAVPTPSAAPPIPTAAPLTPAAAPAPGATSLPTPTAPSGERVLLLLEPRLQGEDVRAVQQRLLDLGYWQVGTIDGVFGPQTAQAVRTFQEENGLEVDGVVGRQTRARLFDPTATTAVIPIVVHTFSSYLLGGVRTGNWLDAPTTASLLTGGEQYRVLTDENAETTAVGSQPNQIDDICTNAYTVNLEPAVSGDAAVAVGGSWPLQPRIPSKLAKNDSALQQAVATFLQSKGIAQPDVQVERALTIDLEGDGSNEVVVVATRLTAQESTDAAAGDYSFAAVQKIVNGQPSLVELYGNYFPRPGDFVAPNTYRIIGILDLNGDGMLEIVVNGAYYEGSSTSAYQVEGNAARALLTTGCGV